MGFLSNIQLIGMNKVKTEANLACHFEKCQCAPGLESLYACIQMYVSMWNLLNNVFFTLLLKRHTVISALRLGNNALFQLSIEGWVLVRRDEVSICAIYRNCFQMRLPRLNTWQLLWLLSSTFCYLQIYHTLCKNEEVTMATLHP